MKRLHTAPGVVGAALAAFVMSACSTMSPIQTSASYNPGDGVPASIGQVSARNLLVVADQKGGPGTLSGSLLNGGDSPVDVTFQTRQASESGGAPSAPVTLAEREQAQITEITFPSIDAAPGELTGIYLITSAGKVLVSVPVLVPEGFYEDLRPAESTPAAAQSQAEATPTEGESTATEPTTSEATTTGP